MIQQMITIIYLGRFSRIRVATNEATHLISRFNFPLRNFSDSNPPAENRSLTSAFPNSGRAAVSTFHRHAFRRSLFQVRDISLVTP